MAIETLPQTRNLRVIVDPKDYSVEIDIRLPLPVELLYQEIQLLRANIYNVVELTYAKHFQPRFDHHYPGHDFLGKYGEPSKFQEKWDLYWARARKVEYPKIGWLRIHHGPATTAFEIAHVFIRHTEENRRGELHADYEEDSPFKNAFEEALSRLRYARDTELISVPGWD